MARLVSIPAMTIRVEGAADDVSAVYMAINRLFAIATNVATVQPTLVLDNEPATNAAASAPVGEARLAAA